MIAKCAPTDGKGANEPKRGDLSAFSAVCFLPGHRVFFIRILCILYFGQPWLVMGRFVRYEQPMTGQLPTNDFLRAP